ncbi:MAG: sugar phosphate nucleotidyltransferase [Candidatus Daviesbacteria bacterium]|nr:sugar phosphate nucleotidyltransferase [Candidatus Daviesbacteria bacterium]
MNLKSSGKNTAAVILAGGKGKRMASKLPKVLHKIAGQPMIYYTLQTINKLDLAQLCVVVGYRSELVKKRIATFSECEFILQNDPLGTGHAVHCALNKLNHKITTILVTNGDDSAFYSPQTLINFISSHKKSKAVISMVTLLISGENKLGRIIRDKEGNFQQILEAAKYFSSGLQSNEINCGAYIFDVKWLKQNIDKILLNEAGEYYLTDLLNIAHQNHHTINLFQLVKKNEWIGINTRKELKYANQEMRRKTNAGKI